MNKWVERALLSAGAALVSTTAIVTTAERPGKRKKRKKRKKGEESRGKDGALVDDDVPRSIGAQAAHDYRVGHDGGITTRQFLENVRDAGKGAARRVSSVGGYLLGKQAPPPAEPGDEEGAAPRARKTAPKRGRKKVRRRVRRDAVDGRPSQGAAKARKKAGAKRARRERSDFDELKDEAVKRAASAAAKHAADKSGLGEAAQKLKESGGELWKKTEQLGKAVKDRVPEDFSERASTTLGEAGKGIARGARALSERLRAALSEEEERARTEASEREASEIPEGAGRAEAEPAERDGEPREEASAASDAGEDGARIGDALKGFARWMEGPGSPREGDGERPQREGRVRRATSDDAVEAKDPHAPAPDVVEPKDPPSPPPDVVEPKDPPDGP